MARAPAIMTEDDDDDLAPVQTQAPGDIPSGLSGNSDVPRQRSAPALTVEPDFQIVETDDSFQPLSGPLAPPPSEFRQEDPQQTAPVRPREKLSGAQRRKIHREQSLQSEAAVVAMRETVARQEAEIAELKGLGSRIDQIDQGRLNDQIATLTRDMDTQARAVLAAETRMSEAIVAGDATAHTTALREYTLALQRGNELAAQRTNLETARQTPDRQTPPPPRPRTESLRQPQAPQGMDPLVAERAAEYAENLPLLRTRRGPDGIARGVDRDSRIALAIDQEIAAEGFDPRDDDYWEEYDSRLRETLPHWFDASARPDQSRQQPAQRQAPPQQIPPQRRGPMVGGANGGAPAPGPRQVLLSPDRKQAMIQVGALDYDGQTIVDRGKFNRLAAAYQKFDRDNGVVRN